MTEIAGTALQATQSSATWLRIVALLYDPFLRLGELAGMRRRRRELLRLARGRVVEIGAGTGLNLEHYPDEVAELVLAEPEPAMRRRLERRLLRLARSGRIVDAPAERLPLPEASVDTVVSTLVLCTVARQTAELMRGCGFVVTADDGAWSGMPPIVRPLVVGRATVRARAAIE